MKPIVFLLVCVLSALSLGQAKPSAGVFTAEVPVDKKSKHVISITLSPGKNGQFVVSGTWKDAYGRTQNVSGTLTRSGSLRANANEGSNKNNAANVYGQWVPNQGLKFTVQGTYLSVILKKKGATEATKEPPAIEIAGKWKARISSQYGWYDFTWDIQKLGKDKWQVEQFLVDTDHPVHKSRVGEQFHSYTIERAKDGSGFELSGSGGDPNPHNPGAFTQSGKVTISNGKISGKCMHKGSQLTHPFDVSATRSKSG